VPNKNNAPFQPCPISTTVTLPDFFDALQFTIGTGGGFVTDIRTNVQTSKFSYRIEPKPDGGFIATSSDPGMSPLEGATREEVQQKIEATITDMIGKLPAIFTLGNLTVRLNSNINLTTRTQSNPQTGTDVVSNSPAQSPMLSSDSPIIPERNSSWFLRAFVGVIAMAVLIYFFYLHK
jgi:hypothetical protein